MRGEPVVDDRKKKERVEETAARARAHVRAFGRSAVSTRALSPALDRIVDARGLVAFADVAGARVLAGPPLAAPADAPALLARAAANRRLCVFGRELDDDEPVPPSAYVVGEQPWWDPRGWPATVQRSRSLRAQLRRAQNKGVVVRRPAEHELQEGAPLRRKIEELVASWLHTRHMAPLSFVVTVEPFPRQHREPVEPGEPEEGRVDDPRLVLVAEQAGVLVGAVVCRPIAARAAWLVEHILRARDAPNGTAELLVDGAMRALAAAPPDGPGAHEVTLGLAPLAGRVPPPLSLVRRLTRGLFDFRGLHEFKQKLKPDRWQRVLVEHPGQGPVAGTVRVLRAFAGGSLARFALLSALRGPPPLLRAVALALIPWTVGLALVDDRWFPAPWLKPAWVTFDALLCAGLFWLAARITRRHRRRWLHRLLAVVVAADAVVTTLQALTWNAPRVEGPGDIAVLAAACLAPAAAAVVLGASLGHREGNELGRARGVRARRAAR